ncbi:hypothetical protein L6164_037069, partial [Bauhinia variegata]
KIPCFLTFQNQLPHKECKEDWLKLNKGDIGPSRHGGFKLPKMKA